MNFKSLFFFLFFSVLNYNLFSQSRSLKINKKRALTVAVPLTVSLGACYWYVENSWWSGKKTKFHFDKGADLVYALNVDKPAHFMGGLQAADIFISSMQWSGVSTGEAVWYGAAFGAGLQLIIELKDGYAPSWGFSKWDLAAGTAGAIWPVAKFYNKNLELFDFKFSYFKHSDRYLQLERQRGKEKAKLAWIDDYPNQTYWLSLDINKFLETEIWPSWLNIALGFGLDDTQFLNKNNTKLGGHNEWYLAFDYNIEKLFLKWDTPAMRKIKKWINYFHFPAPTIMISPRMKFYPLFI